MSAFVRHCILDLRDRVSSGSSVSVILADNLGASTIRQTRVRMIESPPGLADYTALEVTYTSREDLEWNSFENVKLYTNAFVLSKDGSQASVD